MSQMNNPCNNKHVVSRNHLTQEYQTISCDLPLGHYTPWHRNGWWCWATAKIVYGPKRELSMYGGD